MSRRRTLLRYLLARLALAPVMLWLIASLVFLLLRVAPGDPIDALLGPKAPAAARAALRHQLGLDLPLIDIAGPLSDRRELFDDWMHYNPRGCGEHAKLVARGLLESGLL